MRISIRSIILAPAVLAVASFAAISAHAEATLKVPFSFTAAGKQCPAGNYVVSRDARSSLVTLRSKDAARSFTWVAGPGDPAPSATAVTLRFNEKGSEHELRSVQYGSSITSRLDKHTKHNEHVKVDTITGQ
ncbi:MAG TPA: hypothetical protein VL346_04220 [Acidobacteriaceae bacterium]|nr:hypothetical protein [Acidobacteriaceae bacterium]